MSLMMPLLRRYLGLHVFRVMVVPLDALPPVKVTHPHLRYAALPESKLSAWCADPALQIAEKQAKAAYARGDFCVGVTEEGRPVGYIWIAYDAAPHTDGVWLELAPEVRYSYKAFIRESHRGRRISQELYTHASKTAPRRGKTRALVIIYCENTISVRASKSAGRVSVGYAGYVRWGRWLLAFRSPGAKRQGLRFFIPGAKTEPRLEKAA